MLEDCESLSPFSDVVFIPYADLPLPTDNKRATNYSHLASVDLEAFGVYRQPKSSASDPRSKIAFSEFEDEATTDFGASHSFRFARASLD